MRGAVFINDSWVPLMDEDALCVVFRKARVRDPAVDLFWEELLREGSRWRMNGGKEGRRLSERRMEHLQSERTIESWLSQPIKNMEKQGNRRDTARPC